MCNTVGSASNVMVQTPAPGRPGLIGENLNVLKKFERVVMCFPLRVSSVDTAVRTCLGHETLVPCDDLGEVSCVVTPPPPRHLFGSYGMWSRPRVSSKAHPRAMMFGKRSVCEGLGGCGSGASATPREYHMGAQCCRMSGSIGNQCSPPNGVRPGRSVRTAG